MSKLLDMKKDMAKRMKNGKAFQEFGGLDKFTKRDEKKERKEMKSKMMDKDDFEN